MKTNLTRPPAEAHENLRIGGKSESVRTVPGVGWCEQFGQVEGPSRRRCASSTRRHRVRFLEHVIAVQRQRVLFRGDAKVVFEAVEAPRTAKLPALPKPTGDSAACAEGESDTTVRLIATTRPRLMNRDTEMRLIDLVIILNPLCGLRATDYGRRATGYGNNPIGSEYRFPRALSDYTAEFLLT